MKKEIDSIFVVKRFHQYDESMCLYQAFIDYRVAYDFVKIEEEEPKNKNYYFDIEQVDINWREHK